MGPIRVAVVGCGAWAEMITQRIYSSLAEIGQVVATVDKRPERAAKLAALLGAHPYTSLDAALEGEAIDAVDVRLPHAKHAEASLQAIRRGKHVLVEKPLATSLADGEEMVVAAAGAGVVLSVGENYPFLEHVRVARRLLDEQAIGRLLAVRSTRAFSITQGGTWVRDGWRLDASRAGGVLIDQGAHHVNMLRRLVGEITHVQACSGGGPGQQAEELVVVNCRFANGVLGQQFYCWSTATPDPGPQATLYGVAGSIEIHISYFQPGGGVLLLRPDLPGGRTWELQGGDFLDSALPVVEDWLRACRGERQPEMPGEDGLRDLKVVLAAYQSIDSGCEVAVN